MIEAVRQFFRELTGGDQRLEVGEEEIRLAVAALLFHVIAIDGVVSDEERSALGELLKTRFGLDPEETSSLVSAGANADVEAVDLYGFTSVLKRRLGVEDRQRIVEMMWRLVYADGTVHEFEDNVVWRVAELLAVPAQVRIGLKQAVRDNAG